MTPQEKTPVLQRDGFAIGFSAAFGASALLGLLYVGWHLLTAALSIATPFVFAFALALFLESPIERIVRQTKWMKGRRMYAVLLVYLFFLIVIGALLSFLVPALVAQATDLTQRLPEYVQNTRTLANNYLSTHHALGPLRLPPNLETLTAQYSDQIDAALKLTASRFGSLLLGSVSGLLNAVLIPIITFYLLVDLPRLRARFVFLLPDKIRGFVRQTAVDVGGIFGNYVRGMVLVSIAYGIVATGIFLLFGLKSYALLLGFVAGLLYAVPFIGPFVTAVLSGVVCLATGHSAGVTVGLLLTVLAQNQAFDNFVVPRIVGDSVGLHPLMTMFTLFLGAELFGLWGMLLSVPVAASIQVVLFGLFPRLRTATPLSHALPSKQETDNETVVRDTEQADIATETPNR